MHANFCDHCGGKDTVEFMAGSRSSTFDDMTMITTFDLCEECLLKLTIIIQEFKIVTEVLPVIPTHA